MQLGSQQAAHDMAALVGTPIGHNVACRRLVCLMTCSTWPHPGHSGRASAALPSAFKRHPAFPLALHITMAQSKQAMAVALRGLGAQRIAAWAGLTARGRDICSSAVSQHVQPVLAEDNAAAEPAGKAWQKELGAIRTNWT
jgi:hypothetical protein